MKEFGQFCAGITGIVASAVTTGIVLSTMWGWFIVPLGVAPITFWLAIGISLTVNIMMPRPSFEKKTELSESLINTAMLCILKFISLGLGAIVHLFVK